MKLFHVRPATAARVRIDGWPDRATPTSLLTGIAANPGVPLTAPNSAGWWSDEYSGMFTVVADDVLPVDIRITLSALVELRHCRVRVDGERTTRWASLIVPQRFLGRTHELAGAGDSEFVATGVDTRSMMRTVSSADLGRYEAVYGAGVDGLMLWCDPDTSDLCRFLTLLPAVTVSPFEGCVLPDDSDELAARPPATLATLDQVNEVHDGWQAHRASASGRTNIVEIETSGSRATVIGSTSGQDWRLSVRRHRGTWTASLEWGDIGNITPGGTPCNLPDSPYVGPPSGALDLTVVGFAPADITRVETLRADGAVSAAAVPQLLDVGFGWFATPIRHPDVDRARFVHDDPQRTVVVQITRH